MPVLKENIELRLAEALHLVSTAAAHANDAMKRIEKFKKLLEVQESLGGAGVVDLVSPTRELVKEGKIVKISARSGDHQDRYLFLVRTFIIEQDEQVITCLANLRWPTRPQPIGGHYLHTWCPL